MVVLGQPRPQGFSLEGGDEVGPGTVASIFATHDRVLL